MPVELRTIDVSQNFHHTEAELRDLVQQGVTGGLLAIFSVWEELISGITDDWKPQNQPIFRPTIEYIGGDVVLTIEEVDRGDVENYPLVWTFLDRGTKRHDIVPRKAPVMRFRSLSEGYIKGVPGQLYVASTRPGGDLRYTRRRPVELGDTDGAFVLVDHPGVEPRGWTPKFVRRLESRLPGRIEAAMLGYTGYYYDEIATGDYYYIPESFRTGDTGELDDFLLEEFEGSDLLDYAATFY